MSQAYYSPCLPAGLAAGWRNPRSMGGTPPAGPFCKTEQAACRGLRRCVKPFCNLCDSRWADAAGAESYAMVFMKSHQKRRALESLLVSPWQDDDATFVAVSSRATNIQPLYYES